MPRDAWFQLVHADGSMMGESTDFVEMTTNETAAALKQNIMRVYERSLLSGVAPMNLIVFANRVAFAENRRMGPGDSIKALGVSCDDPLIVQVPAPPPPEIPTSLLPVPMTPRLRWKPAPPPPHTLYDDHALHFVNRDDAVKQLCRVHELSFIGATKGGRSSVRRIALADNQLGLGKTVFGLNYIQRCIKNWPEQCKARGFQESLCKCRTLLVMVEPQVFVTAAAEVDQRDEKLTQKLTEATIRILTDTMLGELDLPVGTPPPDFLASSNTMSHGRFLKTVVQELGPVFIVLDEIGQAFVYGDSDDQIAEEKSRKLFLRFCTSVLTTWMNTPGVYFVLMGYAPFLRNVGERKDLRPHASSPVGFCRLNLKLIGPTKIEEIIEKTWVDQSQRQTLAQRWNLDTPLAVKEAARIMFRKTCGHPRTMVTIFQDNATFDDFSKAEVDIFDTGTDPVVWEVVYSELRRWEPVLKDWLPSMLEKTPIDLTKDWPCPGQNERDGKLPRKVSFATITERCHLGWEGTVKKATIYAMPRILAALIGIVQPLRQYIESMHSCIDCVSLAYATVFEWVCLKRLQDLFNNPSSPRAALPDFFGEDTVFGKLDGVTLSQPVVDLPKITTKAKVLEYPSLTSSTANPAHWSLLMAEINQKLDSGLSSSICLKPLAQSSSPDVIFMQRVKSRAPSPGEKRRSGAVSGENATTTLTLGIAVKNYGPTRFGASHLLDECQKFEAMFVGLDRDTKASFGTMTNVLVVCATNYSIGLASEFGSKRYLTKGSWGTHIGEVLLLDLTTDEKRTEFFGLTREPELARVLNELINKAERERDQSED